jgi:hypothetical protein
VRLPPSFSSRSDTVQLALAIVVPAVFGLICGFLLGVSEVAYLVLSILAIAGGFGAGLEHDGGKEGALRGVAGGLLFGTFILVAKHASGADPKADLPHPEVVLVVITTVFGVGLGALGGRARLRRSG